MKRTLLTLFLAGLTLLPAGVDAQNPGLPSPDTLPTGSALDTDGGAEVFFGAFRAIRNYHKDAFGDSTLWNKALKGLVKELNDPYATVFTPDEYDDFEENNTGDYAGIGVTITQLNDAITITAIFRGTPADRVGLQVGDRIVGVDEERVTSEWTIDDASTRIRGPAGTTVDVSVARQGMGEPIPFTIRRDNVHVPAVTADVIRDSLGYVLLDRVARSAAQEVDSALTELEPSAGIILDLRRNPGGYLDEALSLADLFLEPGQTLASARSRVPGDGGETREESWRAQSAARIPGVPIVVLVDEYTASASEILAGALQDHDRALVLGDRTFGKGVVQTVMRIPGDRRLRLTTGSWYTPLGRSLHRQRDADGRPREDDSEAPDPVVVTEAGRELEGGGGVFPDLTVADDTLKTAERELIQAAGRAGIPLGLRLVEFAFEQAQEARESGTDPTLAPEAFRGFMAGLEEEGLSAEQMQDPEVRDYLEWRIRVQMAERAEAWGQALEARMERDRVLARAVELLQGANNQSDLFALAREASGQERSSSGSREGGAPH